MSENKMTKTYWAKNLLYWAKKILAEMSALDFKAAMAYYKLQLDILDLFEASQSRGGF